jgi:hypothetical protein
MPILFITEFAEEQIGPAGRVGQMPLEPPLAEQAVSFGASTQSSAFNSKTRFVRLHTDTNCFLVFGTNPTAVTSTSGRLAANQTEYRGVPLNASFKVAVTT